jgi:hypothetical protein
VTKLNKCKKYNFKKEEEKNRYYQHKNDEVKDDGKNCGEL